MSETTTTDPVRKAAQVEREARRLERVRRLKVIEGGRSATAPPQDPSSGPKAAA